ncbi:hypothetical protein [Methanosarcina mazei]|uniref:Uncharacterized protein n=1 Tax=Methanosarcina mazei TaxID=2209 RepID=A0A0F8I3Y9_METMZ|nr:hypothetical protein [Methanosarcina mazei]KKG83661.1 hypothetical protein DU55_04220 [Methanosarcina mazei]
MSAIKDTSNGIIIIFRELSGSFFQILDSEKISLKKRNISNPVTAIYPNLEAPGVISIGKLLEIILDTPSDETILVILLIPPIFSLFIVKYVQ